MRLNKELKYMGIVVIILFIVLLIGKLPYYGSINDIGPVYILILISRNLVFNIIVIAGLIYWIYEITKFNRSK